MNTTQATHSQPAESLAACPLPTDTLDELDRLILTAHDRISRAEVLRSMIYELYGSIAGVGRTDSAGDELRSLQLVLDAVDAHQLRQSQADDGAHQLPLDSIAS